MMGPVFLAYGLLFALLIQCSDITTKEVSDSDKILADIQGKWKLEDSFIEIEIKGDSVVDIYDNPKDDLYYKDKYRVSITKEIRIFGKLYKSDSNEFFFNEISDYDTTSYYFFHELGSDEFSLLSIANGQSGVYTKQ